MTCQIVHIGDIHFGGVADIPVVEALERALPDLRPDAIVIGGDMSQRARHGEFQRGRAFANLARETATCSGGAGRSCRSARTPSTRSIAAT
jgi:3',5'-cyclic AMP phosphodiesterase CpdA